MTQRPPNDLDWQAFRYIAAEMSPAETAQFEERLDGDQQAREAVSRATELADAVAVASAEFPVSGRPEMPRPAVATRRIWGNRLRWVAVGAAAALAGVLLWQALPFGQSGWPTGDGSSTDVAHDFAASLKDAEFALLWCRTRAEMAQSASDLWPPELPAESLDTEQQVAALEDESVATLDLIDRDPDQPGDVAEAGEVLPSWMLVAVAGELDAVGENGDVSVEN